MADVFISYAREDQPRAAQIAHALEAMGLTTFWDTAIPPGQTWADYIEAKLAECKVVIVLWSAHSTQSQWVREEARMGRDRGRLIPAILDNAQPPFGFGEVQAANLSAWHGDAHSPEWRRFANAVYTAARGEGATPAPQASTPQGVWTSVQPTAQGGWSSSGGTQPGAGGAAEGDLGFLGYVQKCLRLFIDGNGRARRSEYWYWVLFTFVVSIVAFVVDYTITGGAVVYSTTGGLVGNLAGLALLAPGISVLSRRFHDVGMSGWMAGAVFGGMCLGVLVTTFMSPIGSLIMLGVGIAAIVVLVRPGQPGSNQYGPNPKGV